MRLPLPRRRGEHRRPSPPRACLRAESLESRDLLSAAPVPVLSFTGPAYPGQTLDAAAPLGDLTTRPSLQVDAAIGAGAANVDWYAFTLDRPEAVTFAAAGAAGVRPPVLGLYVLDPSSSADPATTFGYRQLTQAAGTDPASGTLLTRSLAAGTYYLAASGAGNTLFSPLVAGSGYDGQTGSYQLRLTATDLGLGPASGPTVLASSPAAGSSLGWSPTVIRLDLSAPIAPTTVLPDVRLTYNPAGTFGDGHDQSVPLGAVHFSAATTELQLRPAAPLAPGYYRLWLAGDGGAHGAVVTGTGGTPLGADALNPSGQDFTLNFRVAGVEGNTAPGAGADDTPAGAHDLGDVSDGRLVQAAGVIGDDPTDPVPFDPSAVNLYHFRVSGPGRYALAAEVFAQRIGSPLNAAASLFVLGSDGLLHLVTSNDDTQNPTAASTGRSLPLYDDPALFAGLTAGDYYLAVSGHGNVPDPTRGLLPGTAGIFNPEVSHSGSAGRSTGGYVLNLQVVSDNVPPRVTAVSPAPGNSLSAPPTYLTVQFDAPVNLQQLAFSAFQVTHQGSLAPVYVQGAGGVLYYPRLQSYDPATGQATFLMLDRLAPGAYDLHLSGPLGLADFAGNPLAGNDPGGDYVVPFTVLPAAPAAPEVSGAAEDLGTLFPHELQGSGFAITGDAPGGYRFQVLQAQSYFFRVDGPSHPAGMALTLTDGTGAAVVTQPQADGVSLKVLLKPGAYTLQVSDAAPAASAYSLHVILFGSAENPQPLTLGPAPVLSLTLAPPPPANPAPAPPGGGPASPQTAAPARGPTAAAAQTAGSGARVELPSGLLAALGAGPVGGVGPGTGGSAAAPQLALGLPGAVAARDPARPAADAADRLSGIVPAAEEITPDSRGTAVGAAFPVAEGQTFVRATVATVARFLSVPRQWLAWFFARMEALTPAGGAGKAEAILPAGNEETAAPAAEQRAGGAATTGAVRPSAAIGLAILAVAASRLIMDRRSRACGTDRPGAPGRAAEECDEPGEATVRI